MKQLAWGHAQAASGRDSETGLVTMTIYKHTHKIRPNMWLYLWILVLKTTLILFLCADEKKLENTDNKYI